MQHFRVKLFAETTADFDLGAAIPVFHRWIQGSVLPEMLIDVADYQHVPDGPGILLVSHEAFYGLDLGKGRLGLAYTRRAALDGSVPDRIRQAYRAARAAADRLMAEPEFAGTIRFPGSFEIAVNDRLLGPNTDEGWQQLEPALRAVVEEEVRGPYTVSRTGQPRDLLTALVQSAD